MAVSNTKPRVLVVDDDRKIAGTLAVILNRNGFDAKAVYSGRGAVKTALKFPPDFIIMDVVMDKIDGVDAAIAISEVLPNSRIMLVSGEAGELQRLAKAFIRGHRFEFLMKPIQTTLLLEWLRSEKTANPNPSSDEITSSEEHLGSQSQPDSPG